MSGDAFGLSRRPFRAAPTGAEVFIGPQTARVMQSMKKALTSPDAVAVVLGPAGTGKTTLVRRAVAGLSDQVETISIARMQLGHDQILELLLDAFGAGDVPASTIKKITLFKRLLVERARAGKRVVLVVEDAVRIGEDALAELEALTEPDGLDNDGAHLVLMGDKTLIDRLKSESLARLSQRVRLYQHVQPLSAAELQAYLKHCFRLAGGEFDLIFADGAADLLHKLSGGVPRIVNKLVDSVLAGVDADQSGKIDTNTIARIARDEFGLAVDIDPAADANTAVPEAEPASAAARPANDKARPAPDDARAGREDDSFDVPELIQDTLPDLETLAPDLETHAADGGDDAGGEDGEDIPTLFSSQGLEAPQPAAATSDHGDTKAATMPVLTLEPEDDPAPGDGQDAAEEAPAPTPGAGASEPPPAKAERAAKPAPAAAPRAPEPAPAAHRHPPPKPSPDPEPEPKPGPQPLPKPEHPPAQEAAAKRAPANDADAEVPDWERDPTLAELRPDIDALEAAMASFAEPEEAADKAKPPEAEEPAPEVELREPTIPALPEITLDSAIQESIAEATAEVEKRNAEAAAARGKEESPAGGPTKPPAPAANEPVPQQSSAGNDPAVKSKADAELQTIAAGLAKAKSLDDVDDKMAETLFGEEFSAIAAQIAANPPPIDEDEPPAEAASPAPESSPAESPAGGSEPSPLEKQFAEVYGQDAIDVSMSSDAPQPGMDLSASQRLATVRALNAERNGGGEKGMRQQSRRPPSPPPPAIEDQIDTSITQTLKTLKVTPPPANDDDGDEEKKGGFFSRFRRG